jgi:hypothetical protein
MKPILAFVVIFKAKFCLLALLAALLAVTGCSGINTSHSVSPASFFLPGLMKAEPAPQPAPGNLAPAEPSIEKSAQS